MTDPHAKPIAINQVDGVLQNYLDQLLVTATEASTAKVETKTQVGVAPKPIAVAAAPVAVMPSSAPLAKIVTKAAPTPPLATPVTPVAAPIPTPPPTLNLQSPDWRNGQGVECLIFKVAGLKLAIPLALLGGVFTVSDKVTPLIGQAAWSLGVWAGDDIKLTIIDSAQLMTPERKVSLRETGYSFFIQLDRSPWALACQEICDTVTLGYSAIKWRGDASKRPWLAGTVIDEMCALVDVPQVLQLLEKQRLTLSR